MTAHVPAFEVSVREISSPHLMERQKVYAAFVNGERWDADAEIRYNARGFVGGVPSIEGRVFTPGERAISEFHELAAIVSGEARERIAALGDVTGRPVLGDDRKTENPRLVEVEILDPVTGVRTGRMLASPAELKAARAAFGATPPADLVEDLTDALPLLADAHAAHVADRLAGPLFCADPADGPSPEAGRDRFLDFIENRLALARDDRTRAAREEESGLIALSRWFRWTYGERGEPVPESALGRNRDDGPEAE